MIEISGGLGYIDVDAVRFTKRLDRIMGQIVREATREWLRAVLKSVPARGGFPVLTGAAKSTLVPLGRFLNNVGGLQVTPVAAPGRSTIRDRRAEGEAKQSFSLTSHGFVYEFEWSNEILHYYINEYFGNIPFAPWDTLGIGGNAWLDYVQDAIDRRLPPELGDNIEIRVPE